MASSGVEHLGWLAGLDTFAVSVLCSLLCHADENESERQPMRVQAGEVTKRNGNSGSHLLCSASWSLRSSLDHTPDCSCPEVGFELPQAMGSACVLGVCLASHASYLCGSSCGHT